MTESEARGFIQGKLDSMNKCNVFEREHSYNTDLCDNCDYCYSQGNFGNQKEAFSVAINALEKQIPKKIIHFQYDDGRINYGCPICKRKIISKIDDKWCAGDFQNFCDRCGQKLDWSEEDE